MPIEVEAGGLGREVPAVERDIDDRVLGPEEVATPGQKMLDEPVDGLPLLLVPANPVGDRLG